jgi:hypothetical protein
VAWCQAGLAADGFCAVDGLLSPDACRTHTAHIREAALAGRGALMRGRLHCNLLEDPAARAAVEPAVAPLLPLVAAFFAMEDALATDTGAEPAVLSQLQLLNAQPGAANQHWHLDNLARGLTVIVPLVATTGDNGPTELLLRSHTMGPAGSAMLATGDPSSVAAAAKALAAGCRHLLRRPEPELELEEGSSDCALSPPPRVTERGLRSAGAGRAPSPELLRAMLPAGGALVFDSRTLHRGRGNLTASHRPSLVFRFDRAETPPPGMGFAGTQAWEWVGWFIAAAFATPDDRAV